MSCAPRDAAGSSAKEIVRTDGLSSELDTNRGLGAMVEYSMDLAHYE